MNRSLFNIVRRRFLKLIIQVILLPIYLLGKLIPKRRDLVIFGSSRGEYYSDNSKYLYEFILKNDVGFCYYWLTKNKNLALNFKGKNFVYIYSLKGLCLMLRANIAIITHQLNDLFPPLLGGTKIIQLWHGTPLKEIGFLSDGWKERKRWENKMILILFKLFPYLQYNKCDYLITSTSSIKDIMANSFKIEPKRIKVLGQPRNDIFFSNNKINSSYFLKFKNKKIYSWLPTHRARTNIKIINLLKDYNFNIKEYDNFLNKNNCILIIKPHFTEIVDLSVTLKGTKNIFIYEEADPYPLLVETDVLITDYSSVYFDYLLLNRPIIFTPFDIELYQSKITGFNFNYYEVTPGPKCTDWIEVLKQLKEIQFYDNYFEDRLRVSKVFNNYFDNNNSKRIIDFILTIKK
ncbi:CDP-glycerol glycerophosphotransferase family protein [Scopulibacillus cellulosilyticus]|uniref:CDP-glycerol glycerophosphotransferase family protein n=1 Tax=Scopulibacillus cellulosilyticus TaxID=2665665 RepID=A0ABW2PXJ1_9BACL